MRCLTFSIALFAVAAQIIMPLPRCAAADGESLEKVAEILLGTTVTVRVFEKQAAAKTRVQSSATAEKAPQPPVATKTPGNAAAGVTLCTGVSLGKGLVISYARPSSTAEFRITVPGGDRADARLRVVDHYSGLVLLKVEDIKLRGLAIAADVPKIGARVVSAAAWGVEKPVVSHGILSGTGRTLPGESLPPLLQCDIRTADTSGGAAIVDKTGGLLGIIVATDESANRAGWTYAVPVSHVQRLVRAKKDGRVVVLKRRRPLVGLVAGQGPKQGTVQVKRVTPGGPADRAGIARGVMILEAEGIKVRSAYEVVKMVINRQPGDQLTLLVRQDGAEKKVNIILGGGIVIDPPSPGRVPRNPAINYGQIRVGKGEKPGEIDFPNRRPRVDRQELMTKATASYFAYIRQLKAENDLYRAKLEQLSAQNAKLQRQLEQQKASGKK